MIPGKPPALSTQVLGTNQPSSPPAQFNNMLLYCVPKVIQVGAEFQVHLRINVDSMKVRQAPCLCASPRPWFLQSAPCFGV